MAIHLLYPLVTEAIRRAEVLEDSHSPDARSAHLEVSRLEEKIAKEIPATDPEGALARRGAVRAALAAEDFDRARKLAERFLAETTEETELKGDILDLLKQLPSRLRRQSGVSDPAPAHAPRAAKGK